MKKILAPTDFSEDASNAIEYMFHLYKDEEIMLYLLHVYDLPIEGMESTPHTVQTMIGEIKTKAQKKIDSLSSAICQLFPRIKCYTLLDFTDVATASAAVVNSYHIDWIVMGTKGASGFKKLVGSNTASVIGNTEVPLLVVPSKSQNIGLKRILFATNFNESDLAAIEQASKIAQNHNAELLLVHIVKGYEHEKLLMDCFEKMVKEKISYPKISYHLKEEEKNVLKALDMIIDSKKIDLVMMSTKERNLLEQFTNPSLTVKMALHTHVPLIVLHHHNYKSEETNIETASNVMEDMSKR